MDETETHNFRRLGGSTAHKAIVHKHQDLNKLNALMQEQTLCGSASNKSNTFLDVDDIPSIVSLAIRNSLASNIYPATVQTRRSICPMLTYIAVHLPRDLCGATCISLEKLINPKCVSF